MSSVRQLASAVAKREGGKISVRIGDIREILKILAELEVDYILVDGVDLSPLKVLGEEANKKLKKATKGTIVRRK